MTAVTFILTALFDGRPRGQAVVCADARYASVAWRGVDRLDRRFASPAAWRAIEGQPGPGLEAGPLAADSPVVELLVPQDQRRELTVQHVSGLPFLSTPENTVVTLDLQLRSLGAE